MVHGDIAARNIVLTRKLICKISDFGMSYRLYAYQTYAKTKLTVSRLYWVKICGDKIMAQITSLGTPLSLDGLRISVLPKILEKV